MHTLKLPFARSYLEVNWPIRNENAYKKIIIYLSYLQIKDLIWSYYKDFCDKNLQNNIGADISKEYRTY